MPPRPTMTRPHATHKEYRALLPLPQPPNLFAQGRLDRRTEKPPQHLPPNRRSQTTVLDRSRAPWQLARTEACWASCIDMPLQIGAGTHMARQPRPRADGVEPQRDGTIPQTLQV